MLIQIGTIAYKQDSKYKIAFPLLKKETKELKQSTKILFNDVYELFINDLFNYCTNASNVSCLNNRLQ